MTQDLLAGSVTLAGVAEAGRVTLGTYVDNEAARRLYAGLGFEPGQGLETASLTPLDHLKWVSHITRRRHDGQATTASGGVVVRPTSGRWYDDAR